jgi:hypothetical protein
MTIEPTDPEALADGAHIRVNGDSWHALEAEEILARLVTFAESGLSNEEARRRLEQYGPNQPKKRADHLLADAVGPSTTSW